MAAPAVAPAWRCGAAAWPGGESDVRRKPPDEAKGEVVRCQRKKVKAWHFQKGVGIFGEGFLWKDVIGMIVLS